MASQIEPVEPSPAQAPAMREFAPAKKRASLGITVAALGIVFGDIGTSPLYTLKTCFSTAHVTGNAHNAVGVISLIVWALIWVVCFKYVTVLMRFDHEGQGGILALLALVSPPKILGVGLRPDWLVWIVLVGAGMLLGDGMITPAISVVSAVEGLNVATPAAAAFVVPISVVVLFALFAIQSRGTRRVGDFFGPVMALWFVTIAVSGAVAIAAHPAILAALNPLAAAGFAAGHGMYGFLIFGAVVLAVTGAEALFADMSHFGRIPITIAWYGLVLPALLLNYLGQGAAVIGNPKVLDSPFYALTPGWTLWPAVVLATAATVIASQSLISGAFTLAEQAIALNLSPRLKVLHTSSEERGQVYVPFINVLLAIATITLVVTFRSSDRLAAAYGLAVACTMAATDFAFYVVATRIFHVRRSLALAATGLFLLVDLTFVFAGLPKFFDGAWFPLVVSAIVTTIGVTWLEGRRCVAKSLVEQQEPVDRFLQTHPDDPKVRGTMVMLTGDPGGVPFVTKHQWLRPRLEEERLVLLTLVQAPRPFVDEADRVLIERKSNRFVTIAAAFGYMERPRITPILQACKAREFDIDDDATSFVYADPAIVPAEANGMPPWQRNLFITLTKLSRSIADELQIKPNRRVELGLEVDL